VTKNILHNKAVYNLNYTPHAEAEAEYAIHCKTPSCTTQFKKLQATSFSFASKPSSHLSNIKSHSTSLHLHVTLRSHSLTTVIKTYVKIHTSCVKLKDEYKNHSFK